MENIMNIASYAYNKPYIVARECDGELWFWDAFEDASRANEAAMEIGGEVIVNH